MNSFHHQMTIEEIFAPVLVDSVNIPQNILNLFSFFLAHQKPAQDWCHCHLASSEMLPMPRTVNHTQDGHWTVIFFPELIEVQNDIFDRLESRY